MSNIPSDFWTQSAGQMQKAFVDNWTTAMQAMQGMAPMPFSAATTLWKQGFKFLVEKFRSDRPVNSRLQARPEK